MTGDPLVISVVGASGSGKTTVIERLVASLCGQGIRVGTVKHASHGFAADREGSDSWRHQQAGAERVLLVGPHGAVLFLDASATHPNADADPHTDIARLIGQYQSGLDVVLAEGFAPVHDLLIEVDRRDVPRKPTVKDHPVWLTITDEPDGATRLGFDAIDEIASRIIERVVQP